MQLEKKKHSSLQDLPRNLWAVSLTSFLTDISTEMVINLVPLYLANVVGIRTNIIGLIEGVAEATASLLKVVSGWYSDRLRQRKWVAVAGYAISTLAKPFYYVAGDWWFVAGARWADRLGKGIRTAPRDALIADSIDEEMRGLAFGFHRASDTAGAVIGLLIALGVVWYSQSSNLLLSQATFQRAVLISLVPAVLAVLVLAIGSRDVVSQGSQALQKLRYQELGRPFLIFLALAGLFDLGNSSDAFLVLRAQERGLSVVLILAMLVTFNLVYSLLSTWAGALSDRVERRRVIIGGWLFYALVYLGFALAQQEWHIWVLYLLYGVYYALAYGTAKALVADLVPTALRGTAYGLYNAVLGLIDLPASLLAGILWQGVGSWSGFGPSAPFYFSATVAVIAALGLIVWQPPLLGKSQ
ncbi:MAG: MFS transporter [Caldilineaceae bacterium]